MEQLLVVSNPSAGSARSKALRERLLSDLTTAGLQFESLELGTREFSDIARLGAYDAIIVVGGDGTVRSALQHIQEKNLDLPIAILPAGTGNLIAKTLGLRRSASLLVRALKQRKTVALDVGKLESGEYFCGAFAIGYLGERIAATPRAVKRILGFGGYLWSFLQLQKLPLHRFIFNVDDVDYQVTGHSLLIVSASKIIGIHSRRVGGVSDGLFECVVTKNTSFFTFPGLVADFYLRTKHPKHFSLATGRRFTIKCDAHASLLLDGETIEGGRTITIEVLPKRQRFIVP